MKKIILIFLFCSSIFAVQFGTINFGKDTAKKAIKKWHEKNSQISNEEEIWPEINKNPKFQLQGFNLCAWGKDWYSDKDLVKKALKFVLEEGANLVILDWAVNFNDDGTIVEYEKSLHPYWEDIEWLIQKAKSLGLYVMLKPHTTLSNSPENRNYDNTTVDENHFSPTKFFNDYKEYLLNLCNFASKNKVDFLCIGTEKSHIDWQPELRDDWIDIINMVRKNFSGEITYDALFNRWSRNVKDIEEVIFLDQLDFIGISLYVPITTNDDADVETIKRGWREDLGEIYGGPGWFEINDVVQYLYDIVVSSYNKKLMAVEGGYQSKGEGALYYVNNSSFTYEHDKLQSRGLEGYFSVIGEENKKGWILGITVWDLTPYMISDDNLKTPWHTQSFSVYNKPAAEVVKKYYYNLIGDSR